MIIAPETVILTSQSRKVSPRSALSSDKYNTFVNETGADLRNIKIQLNRVLDTINTGTIENKVWDNISDVDNNHGIDAVSIYWDSTAGESTRKSIYEHVEEIRINLSAEIVSTSTAESILQPSRWVG